MLAKRISSPALRKLGRILGWLTMLAALAYLAREVSALNLTEVIGGIGISGWLAIAAGSAGYAALLSLLAMAWFGMANTDRLDNSSHWAAAWAIYAPGVVAKYLPGSVFQYASRQLLGAKHGLPHGSMGKSSVVEAGIHPVAALTAAALILTFGWIGGAIMMAIGALLGFAGSLAIMRAIGLQMAFFAGFALVTAGVVAAGFPVDNPTRFAAYYMVAWLAGFLVPIAPGGIGVREAVLVALGSAAFGAAPVAVMAVTIRLVTLSGDALFGMSAYFAGPADRVNKHASA